MEGLGARMNTLTCKRVCNPYQRLCMEGDTIELTDGDIATEIALGFHPRSGNPMSSYLNHFNVGQVTEVSREALKAFFHLTTLSQQVLKAMCDDMDIDHEGVENMVELCNLIRQAEVEADEADETVDLSTLKKAELEVICGEKGIKVPEKAKKADLVALIEAQVAESTNTED